MYTVVQHVEIYIVIIIIDYRMTTLNNIIIILCYSLAALELSEWRKQHSNKNHNHHKNNSKNEIDKHLHENSKNDTNDDDDNNEKLNYNLFKIASRQLESTYTLSLDIQERYGINTNT
jgi:hypothetical protein